MTDVAADDTYRILGEVSNRPTAPKRCTRSWEWYLDLYVNLTRRHLSAPALELDYLSLGYGSLDQL